MKRRVANLLYFFSPCVLCIIFCFFGFIINAYTFSGDTQAWSYFAASLFLPCFFVFTPVVLAVRFISGDHVKRIWIIEMALLVLLYLVFILQMPVSWIAIEK
ncbi:MAG TPA: hypothetical protein VHN59_16360 [Chitinophagaceae bacterium]|nr:hypothetical protein [Chitinophagaceae bacterium]